MRDRCVYPAHRQPSGRHRGGKGSAIKQAPVPSPCNCNTPCCYGRGTSFCWPCMKKLMEEHRTNQKG